MIDRPQNTNRRELFALLALLALAFGTMLFYRGFFDPDEGRYSEIPREMVARGDWRQMRMLDYLYYEKPPLSYWLVAPFIRIFGAHDWAARMALLPNLLSIFAVVWLLVRRAWPGPPGTLASLAVATLAGIFAGTTILLTDAFLLFWFTATCAALYMAFQPGAPQAQRRDGLLLAAVTAALGLLTKGAQSVVLPGGIIFFWLLWERRLKELFTVHLLTAAALFLLIVAPTLWWIERHNPGFFRQFMIDEHLGRFTGRREMQVHPEPCWFYLTVLPALLLPWTLFLFRAGRHIWRQRVFKRDSLSRYLWVWALVVIIFFSAGKGKLMSYVMPALVPLGLLLGRWGLAEPDDGTRADRVLWRIGVVGPFLLAPALAGLWLIAYFQWLPDDVYRISGISLIAFLPLACGLWALLRAPGWRAPGPLFLYSGSFLLTVALLLSPLSGRDFNVLIHINSADVYKRLNALLKPEDNLVVFWDYRPALPFYTRRLYYPFMVKNELMYGMRLEPDRPADLQTAEELRQLAKSRPGRWFGLIEPGDDYQEKFLPLGIPHRRAPVPADPDTVVYELDLKSGNNEAAARGPRS